MSLLANSKTGEPVAIYGGADKLRRGVIGRTTPTRVIVDDVPFRRSTGKEIGPPTYRDVRQIEPWIESEHAAELKEIKAERKLNADRNNLTRYPWFKITQDEANAVLTAMAAAGMLKRE